MDRKRLIAVIAVVTLIIAGIGVGAWRGRHHDTTPHHTPTTAVTTRRAATPTPTRTPAMSVQDATRLAIAFEHAARDWGADPNATVTDNATLATLRTPETLDRTAFNQVASLPAAQVNADSPSAVCAEDPTAATCKAHPTRLSYWRANWYELGARLDGEPTPQANTDGTLTVTGKLRLVAWANADNAATVPGYWGYSPRTWSLTYTDTLTIRNGKVAAWRTSQPGWLAAPMTGDWSADPLAQIPSDSTQTDTPVAGDLPDLGLDPDPGLAVMANSTDTTSTAWTDILAKVAPGQPDEQGNEQSDSQRLSEQDYERLFGGD